MQEKVATFKKETGITNWRQFVREKAVWIVPALIAEAGSGAVTAAPGAAALAAGMSGERTLFIFIGGVIGAAVRGFPEALDGLAALAIVLAARLIPDLNKPKIRAAERFITAGLAVFLSRIASVTNAGQLLSTILASLVSALFALCVCLRYDSSRARSLNITEPRDCTLVAVELALWFFSAGGMDYSVLNVGRLIFAYIILVISAQRGAVWFAATAIPAVAGLYPTAGGGAAVMAFAAAASAVFAKYNKPIRAAAFVFFTAFTSLVTGIDESSWRIITESVIAAAAFTFIPIEKIGFSKTGTLFKTGISKTDELIDDGFSDSTVAAMIRERLNFAAEAMESVGTGISAAAETLDRKYTLNFDEVIDRAADKVCRTCPNSMVCWGRKYARFQKEFARLAGMLRSGTELTEFSMSPECSEDCVNRAGVVRAITAEYSRYISAAADERRIKELRKIYTDELESVRDILKGMGSFKSDVKTAGRCRAAKQRTEKLLRDNGARYPKAFVMLDANGKLKLEAYSATEPRVEREYLGVLLSRTLGRDMELPEVCGGNGRFRITASEHTALSVRIGAYQIPRGQNRVCGDCYDTFTDAGGIMYVILSDGMGTGSRARVDSAMACSILAKLIKGGIALPAALETVNTALMIKSSDESFATLDICRIDLNTGECVVYKAGAATTYIRSSDKLIRASLSSPPAGLGGRLTVPAQKFSVTTGDIIIMMTDGVIPDEQWLSRELSKTSDPDAISECIAKAARSGENSRDDDISVIALQVGR